MYVTVAYLFEIFYILSESAEICEKYEKNILFRSTFYWQLVFEFSSSDIKHKFYVLQGSVETLFR